MSSYSPLFIDGFINEKIRLLKEKEKCKDAKEFDEKQFDELEKNLIARIKNYCVCDSDMAQEVSQQIMQKINNVVNLINSFSERYVVLEEKLDVMQPSGSFKNYAKIHDEMLECFDITQYKIQENIKQIKKLSKKENARKKKSFLSFFGKKYKQSKMQGDLAKILKLNKNSEADSEKNKD